MTHRLGASPHRFQFRSTVLVLATGLLTLLATAAWPAESTLLWASRYTGPGNGYDSATDVAVSPDGSRLFVTGSSQGSGGPTSYATVAYDQATGAQVWATRYNGPGNRDDDATALAVSPDGSRLFVTGASHRATGGDDFVTVAYDAATGAQVWVARYNGPGNKGDIAPYLVVSPSGTRVFVAGTSVGLHSLRDYATLAYNAATGAQVWVARYNGPGNGNDQVHGLGISPDGSRVFVTGESAATSVDYATVAYDTSTGSRAWLGRYDGLDHDWDAPLDLAVAPDGATVVVTGGINSGTTSDNHYGTVAYDSATGAQKWLSEYEGRGNSGGYGASLVVSPDGTQVYVTGDVYVTRLAAQHFATVAYAMDTGAEQWARRYKGPPNSEDYGVNVAASADGQTVIVAGEGTGPGGGGSSTDFVTIAYDATSGGQLWDARFDPDQNGFDSPYAITASPTESKVFEVGVTESSPSHFDYGTVAYGF